MADDRYDDDSADTATYTVTFVAPVTGSITNLAAATSSTGDPVAIQRHQLRRHIDHRAGRTAGREDRSGLGQRSGHDHLRHYHDQQRSRRTHPELSSSDTLPAGVSFVSANRSATESSGGVVTWPVLGDTGQRRLSGRQRGGRGAGDGGDLVNLATVVASTTGDTDATNNTSSDSLEHVDHGAGRPGGHQDRSGFSERRVTPSRTRFGSPTSGRATPRAWSITDTLPGTGTFVSASERRVGVGRGRDLAYHRNDDAGRHGDLHRDRSWHRRPARSRTWRLQPLRRRTSCPRTTRRASRPALPNRRTWRSLRPVQLR